MQYIFFTTHKAASTGCHEVLRAACEEAGVYYYTTYFRNLANVGHNGKDRKREFENRKGVFGPVRRPCEIGRALDRAKISLHLRDPRDCLTSMFFSWTKSHPHISDAEREEWAAEGIDGFVLREASDFMQRYEMYAESLLGRENVTLLKYEDMIADYPAWLAKVIAPIGLDTSSNTYQAMTLKNVDLMANLDARGEDPSQHVRSVKSGDYLDKLRPETIGRLNSEYGALMARFGYGETYATKNEAPPADGARSAWRRAS